MLDARELEFLCFAFVADDGVRLKAKDEAIVLKLAAPSLISYPHFVLRIVS